MNGEESDEGNGELVAVTKKMNLTSRGEHLFELCHKLGQQVKVGHLKEHLILSKLESDHQAGICTNEKV